MNIGFDLDKVFIDYPFFLPDFIIDRLYKKKANGQLIYRIPNKPEQMLRLLIHHPFLRQPIKENVEFMKDLASKNTHKHYLISSRLGFLKEKTLHLVKKHQLNKLFEDLYFNFENKQAHIFKNEIIQKLKIDMYVDDDLHLLKYLAQNNAKTKFFWLNKKIKKNLGKNLFAIKTLPEMFS